MSPDTGPTAESPIGVVLAAGQGSRAGGPKALRPGWLEGSVRALREGGCPRVVVVLGAEGDRARDLVPVGADIVIADDWALGLSASLRAGLRKAAELGGDTAIITLVDLTDLSPVAVARVLDAAGSLARSSFEGRPGHPVRIDAQHWDEVAAAVHGDAGAGSWLATQPTTLVEMSDLFDGIDQDY